MSSIRLGALCWNQYTDWPAMLEAGRRADRLGFDTLWTWDHLYPIVGSWEGPILEGWTVLTGWAMATDRIRIGLMVGANTFREPALTAKIATTLDHVSGGRAILGIGAAWFEREHLAFGLRYGEGPTAAGPRYSAGEVRNDPPPIQARLPLLVGGGGEKVTLRLVARYADANNVGGGIEAVRRKEAILLEHCEREGRDPAEIERTTGVGTVIIRDSREEARRVFEATFARNGNARPWEDQPVGTPEDVVATLAPFPAIGYRHLIAGFPSPYDEESMTRLALEVRPALETG